MAEPRKGAHLGAPPSRTDYLPDSRILTAADKAERKALFETFGANMKSARLRAGMTQRELAIRADISNETFISKLELGTRAPNLIQLIMLAHALNVSCEALLAHVPIPKRERSRRTMLALVRREPGIDVESLADHLHVKAIYILNLGKRLTLEGVVMRDGARFWPASPAEESS